MTNPDRVRSKPNSKGYGFSLVIAGASFAIIVGFILYLIVNAFGINFGVGLRSLAAGLLPPLAVTYISRFTDVFEGSYRNQFPRINLYVLSALWMTFLLVIFDDVYDPKNLLVIPVVELLFSFTLVIMILCYRGKELQTALALSYGIISGLLIYLIFIRYFLF